MGTGITIEKVALPISKRVVEVTTLQLDNKDFWKTMENVFKTKKCPYCKKDVKIKNKRWVCKCGAEYGE